MLFEEIDKNENGLISLDELAEALNVDPDDEALIQAIADADLNGNSCYTIGVTFISFIRTLLKY